MEIEIAQTAEELEGLLPELEYARETHVQWRDCQQKDRDANPDIGDADFHERMVRTYDVRIETIRKAASLLRRLTPNDSSDPK